MNNKTKKFNTMQLATLGLMTAVLIIMSCTPLGYLNIGPLAISFNVIPPVKYITSASSKTDCIIE